MQEISVLDGLVFFTIILFSMPFHLTLSDIVSLTYLVLANLPSILWPILVNSLGRSEAIHCHYRNVSNPVQQIIISLAGLAFDRVHHTTGRLFLNESNCLKFLRWRLGKNYGATFQTFTIPRSEKHKELLCYQLDNGIQSTNDVRHVILYLHGGGFVVASVPFYIEFLNLLQKGSPHTVVISPEYDLAPESTYPTQLDQLLAIYLYIRTTYRDARIILGGDSAGCALCQALLLSQSSHDSGPEIYKAFYISPWLDLDAICDRSSGYGDFISPQAVKKYGSWYTRTADASGSIAGADSQDLASPLSASETALQRSIPVEGMYITCGAAECLRSDALTFMKRVDAGSKRIKFHMEPNEIHAYVLTNLYLRRGSFRFNGLNRILEYLKT